MSSNEKFYTLDDIMNIIESESCVFGANIYISPPLNNADSDEDSGEEDDADINHLSRNQLLAETEGQLEVFNDGGITSETISTEDFGDNTIHQSADNNSQSTIIVDESVEHPPTTVDETIEHHSQKKKKRRKLDGTCEIPNHENVTPPEPRVEKASSSKQPKKNKKQNRNEMEWERKDIKPIHEKEWEIPDWLMNYGKDPVGLFELFYDDEIIQLICNQTNMYAAEKGLPSNYTAADIRCFIGILLTSGYCEVPRVKMYWEMKDDVWNKGIAEAMPRNKFLSIMRCLHVCDNNNLDKDTKFAKVAPLWKKLNERWCRFFDGEAHLSIDETMIPYYGRHSAKQHIHGKPIRFGYKAWSMCTRLGYLVQANLYEGSKSGNNYPELGVGSWGIICSEPMQCSPSKK
ncbi:piggyBac transposable element-derived protein 3-like [Nilaparvata lugens]|uniref:piggyBac transposable element-derived protein 3-like n=1 Tax=Nilaparvata lugens TaxID=108931 RepID=UPI00193D43CB|nr:piggyBac transposable element-derived protein 3-like [Nilaparvata lugens]